jgi:hypothetical protein
MSPDAFSAPGTIDECERLRLREAARVNAYPVRYR